MKAYLWTNLILAALAMINHLKENNGSAAHGFFIAFQAGFIAWTVYFLTEMP